VDEAHVEHLIGFIEHECFDVPQIDDPLVDQIEQPAGRGDDDVDPAADRDFLAVLADGRRRYGRT